MTHASPLPSGTTHASSLPRSDAVDSDFAPLVDAAPRRVSVAEAVANGDVTRDVAARASHRDSDRLIGTLVHRLVQRFGFDAGDDLVTREAVIGMRRPEEMVDPAETACIAALRAYRALCARPDIRAAYAAGERLHEVPFTMQVEGAFIRGSIDCLVRTAADRLTVLEFKTGRPRAEHRAQVDLYRQAAERLFPGCIVDARLVYADEAIVA
jgi:ATP-dependent exoDNAse (exonuclease V) beta subunit